MNNRKAILIGLILLAVGIGFLFLPVKAWTLALQGWIKGLGLLGPQPRQQVPPRRLQLRLVRQHQPGPMPQPQAPQQPV